MQKLVNTIVRKLADSLPQRQDFDAGTTVLAYLALGLIAAGTAAASQESAIQWHPTSDVASVAETFLSGRLGAGAANTTVKAGMLDGRLKLANCGEPLEGFLRPGTKIGPKTIVGVRCSGSRPWTIYVPVEVVVKMQVWVARQPLPRGHLLTREDLAGDIRNVSRMRAYQPDPDLLIGRRLRTSILAGRVLEPNLLEANNIVTRGQTVTLAIASGGVNIRMTGKALMDGALNQRIRVENLNSGRIVEGIVRSPELVEILVPATGKIIPTAPKVSGRMVDTGYSNNDR
ncbi:MAG: flagellar basal body P-ring formation protein FlgA [Woeseiaceae bacterium]|nr:flagellar basal body P-ring formation protein FlgA [Woeseiaceae bacterium]